jgi:uncharacterized phage-associated protein
MDTLNEEKYRNAILYFAKHIGPATLGKVKLMKLLYYLDFDHFEKYGVLVMGDTYIALPMGPKPQTAERILAQMEHDGLLEIRLVDLGLEHPKTEYVPLASYDIHVFTPDEAEILMSVAEKWQQHSQQEMIHATHGDPPWIFTEQKAVIDPRLVHLRSIQESDMESDEPMTQDTNTLQRHEIELRADGRALVAQTEEYVRTHPEFALALKSAISEIEGGEYDTFDERGWREG